MFCCSTSVSVKFDRVSSQIEEWSVKRCCQNVILSLTLKKRPSLMRWCFGCQLCHHPIPMVILFCPVTVYLAYFLPRCLNWRDFNKLSKCHTIAQETSPKSSIKLACVLLYHPIGSPSFSALSLYIKLTFCQDFLQVTFSISVMWLVYKIFSQCHGKLIQIINSCSNDGSYTAYRGPTQSLLFGIFGVDLVRKFI